MRRLLLTLLVLCSTTILADDPPPAPEAAAMCPPDYGYSGYLPPAQWKFVEAWDCGKETVQSPIAISGPYVDEFNKPVFVGYHQDRDLPTVMNSGHDFRVFPPRPSAPEKENWISGTDLRARLVEFHFHVPAEHTLDGVRYDAEMHLVHINPTTSKIYVIAVLLRKGDAPNTALQPVFEQLPLNLCKTATAKLDLTGLLPKTIHNYYRYIGSLTTPPCTGGVTFFVLPVPMDIGAAQLTTLHHFGENARPLIERPTVPHIAHVRPRE